jgi:uncharacterized protein (DUF4415 family)
MSKKMVSYTLDTLPPITDERLAEMKVRAALPIDTSDIPEMTDEQFKTAVRSRFHKPVKKQITAHVDADVLAWLKSQGRGYQTRLNAILRREMLASIR